VNILRNIDYIKRMYGHTVPPREFESAFAAFEHGDANPTRQYLGLPLQMPCEDCGEESIPHGHGKSIVCLPCYAHREAFLMDNLS
jgi:hypothetical protein